MADPVEKLTIEPQLDENSPGKYFCVLPFIHFNILQSGQVTLCCCSDKPLVEDGKELHIRTHSMNEAWNSKAMQSVRSQMLAGKPVSQCADCYKAESQTGVSLRTAKNKDFLANASSSIPEKAPEKFWIREFTASGLPKPTYFDVRFENVCNLKCVMCSPLWSSGVERDSVQARWHKLPNGFSRVPNRFGNIEAWIEAPELFEELRDFSQNTTVIQWAGGEPFLSKLGLNWIRYLVESGKSKNIKLNIFTNFLKATNEIYDLLAKFKEVTMILSIDATNRLYDFIRYPGKWSTIEQNAAELGKRLWTDLKQTKINVNITVSAYNATSVPETIEWAKKQGFSVWVGYAPGPAWLNAHILPRSIHLKVKQQLEGYLNDPDPNLRESIPLVFKQMFTSPSPEVMATLITSFICYTNDLKKSRKMDFNEICPEIRQAFETSYGFWHEENQFA